MFKTYDSFKPQESGDSAKVTGWADIDLEDVKAKLQSVVEEAKANDPTELKKRIRELEKQVAAKPAAGKPWITHEEFAQSCDEARTAGFNDGANHGYRRGWLEHRAALTEAIAALPGDPPVLGGTISVPAKAISVPANTTLRDLAGKAYDAGARVQVKLETNSSRVKSPVKTREKFSGSTVTLSKAERRCLTALAQYPNGRTKSQVAILSGYAINGGGFNNALSSLRVKGYLEGATDRLRPTDSGVDALGDFDPLPQGDDLLRHWLGQLSKAERGALETLTRVYPKSLTKDELAKAAGYEANGGGFNNALSRLRTLELISGRGELRASEDLF
jgi:hypothetical protein